MMSSPPDMESLPGSVTLTDVARRAGVSGMTVSRVLRDAANVSQETRQRVLAAVAELGYVPNRLAGALASARTKLVVVILPSLSNIVFPEVLRGANERLETAGYQAVIGVSDYSLIKEETLIEVMRSWRPSGWIVAGLEHTERARQMLSQAGSPVVEIMDINGEPIDMAVGLSQERAGYAVGAHFARSGRRRIGYVGDDLTRDLRAGKRRDGFLRALAEHNLTLSGQCLAQQPSSLLLGRSGMASIMEAHPDVDAVYFSNDDMAVGGLMHCMGNGIDVPGRVALAGFNGLEIGEIMPLRLTTVKSPRYDIGRVAADQILERLAGRMPNKLRDLGFELIRGQTG